MNNILHRFKSILLIPLSLALCACFGSAPPPARPEIQLRTETLLEQAIRAEQKNDIKRAQALLEESLRLSTAVEDTRTTIRTLINLARLQRIHLQAANASNAIDSALMLLTQDMDMYPEAAQEKALLLLGSGNTSSALEWANKSINSEKGVELGKRLNLAGRILLLQGKDQDAAVIINQALKQNTAAGHAEEQANSLRMLGIISRSSKNYPDSEKLLTEALELDKKLAISSKIAADLEELASTAIAGGKPKAAVSYLQRAYLVHFGAGRLGKAGAVQDRCAEIFTGLNDRENADKARETSRVIAEMLKTQPAVNVPETTKPSSRP